MIAYEEWRPIPGWEGLYEASSQGRIRSVDRIVQRRHRSGKVFALKRKGQIIRSIPWGDGRYLSVTLKNCGVSLTSEVQCLICATFHGPRPKGLQAAHADGNPANNCADNLRWATASENARDAIVHGTAPRGRRHGMAKLSEDDVQAIRADSRPNGVVGAEYGVSHTCISRIRSGDRWNDRP